MGKLSPFFTACMLFVAACASGSTTVLEPAQSDFRAETITVRQAEDTVEVDQAVSEEYGVKLAEYLYEEGVFSEGGDITVEYRFIQMEEGSRALRYVVGLGAGKASMTIESVFLDQEGNELAKIQSGGEISGGLFGGGLNEAVAKAAKETADFAIDRFASL
ncbi:MAG: DUF4410 domain-containing protein [Pseudomonadota bacterium]